MKRTKENSHYGIIMMGGRFNQSVFWLADEDWNIVYSCKAYAKDEYCKYIHMLMRRWNINEHEFRHKMHLINGKEAALTRAASEYELGLKR